MLTLCSAEINIDKAENNTHPHSLKISTKISPPRFFLIFVSPQVMTPFSFPALLKCIMCSGSPIVLGIFIFFNVMFLMLYFWDVLCEANQESVY